MIQVRFEGGKCLQTWSTGASVRDLQLAGDDTAVTTCDKPEREVWHVAANFNNEIYRLEA